MRTRDPKAIILERRARFIAASLAALTGLAIAPRALADGGDASSDAGDDASEAEDAGDTSAEPQTCLCVLAPSRTSESTAPVAVATVAIVAIARRRRAKPPT